MIIKVFSRRLVEQGIVMDIQEKNPGKKVGVISIRDMDADRPASIIHHQKDFYRILRLNFDDVEVDTTGGWGSGYFTISKEQAKSVVDFLLAAKENNVEILVVHCEAGISRSAGVAGACSVILGQSDEEFFRSPYNPNMKVYRTVITSYDNSIPITRSAFDAYREYE
jgi:predicted protein tyrosine phosphatase